MRLDHPPRETLRERLERDRRAIDALLADPAIDNVVLEERSPNAERAWLRVNPGDSRVVEVTGSRPAHCAHCGQGQ
jgi:hypothetical protein